MGIGPAQQYLAQFNGQQLPGYVQNESFDSVMNIADHPAPYIDGELSEATGLGNKNISLTLKVWEQDYLTCKQQVQLAATILRSTRVFTPLYIQYTDRYYSAICRSIQVGKQAGTAVKTLDYTIEFEAKPWVTADETITLSGSQLDPSETMVLDTDDVGRDLLDGGWSPTIVTITGESPALLISGTSVLGGSTGYMEIEGAVTGLTVDTEAFTAYENGLNANNKMVSKDYRLYVGPGKTTFSIEGATECTISYKNRWYI